MLDSCSRAADRCSQEKRKTLTGDDILFAMATLGFDNYIQPMKLYLQKIRDVWEWGIDGMCDWVSDLSRVCCST